VSHPVDRQADSDLRVWKGVTHVHALSPPEVRTSSQNLVHHYKPLKHVNLFRDCFEEALDKLTCVLVVFVENQSFSIDQILPPGTLWPFGHAEGSNLR
jgi:hypothetical protein